MADEYAAEFNRALAARMLALVEREGSARPDGLDELGPHPRKAMGAAARELERALLMVGTSLHTEAGAHAKRVETWARWAGCVEFVLVERMAPEEGQRARATAVAGGVRAGG